MQADTTQFHLVAFVTRRAEQSWKPCQGNAERPSVNSTHIASSSKRTILVETITMQCRTSRLRVRSLVSFCSYELRLPRCISFPRRAGARELSALSL